MGFYKLLQIGSETTDRGNAFENSGISLKPLSFFLLSLLLASSHFRNVTFVLQSGEEITPGGIEMVLPGSEIPEWFGDKGVGSSLTIQLPSNCHQLKGIAFCLVFLLPPPSRDVYSDVHVKYKNGEHFASRERHVILYNLGTCDSDHMILQYRLVNQLPENYGNGHVTYRFYLLEEDSKGRMVGDESRRPFELKSWGVYLQFDENLPADTDLP